MERVTLEGRLRESVGSTDARRMRNEGWVPANIYGKGEPNTHCLLDARKLTRAIRDEHYLMLIELGGGRQEKALLKEIQWDALGSHIVHVDLTRARLEEIVETSAPVHTLGAAKGVSSGGTLDVLHHAVPLRGKAIAIPESIEIEVSALELGESIKASDLTLPEGVECLLEADDPVVIVQPPRGASAAQPA